MSKEWRNYCAFAATITACICVGLLVSYWTRGPYHKPVPQNCGHSGVKRIIPDGWSSVLTIICNNGSSYRP